MRSRALARLVRSDAGSIERETVQFAIADESLRLLDGAAEQPDVYMRASLTTFASLARDPTQVVDAVTRGKLRLSGEAGVIDTLRNVLGLR